MDITFSFIAKSFLLGLGLAMDAFSVSLANGLNEPKMKLPKIFGISGVFAVFQGLMPMIGWVCVHTVVQKFQAFEKFIPWIALILLSFIGGKMLIEGIKNKDCNSDECAPKLGFMMLLMQGVATSIDALSVGFTIADQNLPMAAISALIIAVVTFITCFAGVCIGKKFGTKLSNKTSVFGGIILILIGLEIFLTGIF